jgi:hypothetical protein
MIDKEAIYDEHISPLMEKIIALVVEHDIPFGATFQLTDGEEAMFCTTTLPAKWQDDHMRRVNNVLTEHNRAPTSFEITTRNADGKVVESCVCLT